MALVFLSYYTLDYTFFDVFYQLLRFRSPVDVPITRCSLCIDPDSLSGKVLFQICLFSNLCCKFRAHTLEAKFPDSASLWKQVTGRDSNHQ